MIRYRSTGAGLQLHSIEPLERCYLDRLPAGISWWIAAEFLAPLLRGEQLVRTASPQPGHCRTALLAVEPQDQHALQGVHRLHQREGQERRRHRRDIDTQRARATAGGQTRQVVRFDLFSVLFFSSLDGISQSLSLSPIARFKKKNGPSIHFPSSLGSFFFPLYCCCLPPAKSEIDCRIQRSAHLFRKILEGLLYVTPLPSVHFPLAGVCGIYSHARPATFFLPFCFFPRHHLISRARHHMV